MIDLQDYQYYYSQETGWTIAIAKAIEKLCNLGGGVLYLHAGIYRTYPIHLYSNITLYLEAGATLDFIPNLEGYEILTVEFEGEAQPMYMPCIYANGEENVTIAGNGTIQGNGAYWWNIKDTIPAARPYLIHLKGCSHVKLQDVKLLNSPAWTVHPIGCEDVEVRGISVQNPRVSPNTDGINPEGCKNVRILDCLIDVGDDCITLKAGTEKSIDKLPCENITITNCNMVHGHGGVVIGSEMSGGVRNVTISNCVFQDTDRGIRVKTRRGRGGAMERIVVSNVIMDRVLCPFTFNMYYRCGADGAWYKSKEPQPVTEQTPKIRQIQIQNVIVHQATAAAGFFYGLAEQPIEDIMFSDCTIHMDPQATEGEPAMLEDMEPMKAHGIFLRCVKNVSFRNVRVYDCNGEVMDVEESSQNVSWE